MLKRSVMDFLGLQIVKIIARTVYFAGLTALIPLAPLVLSPEKFVNAEYAFGVAFGLIFLGFFLIYWFSSRKEAMRILGFMTLIPGFLGVIFLYAPRHILKILGSFGISQHIQDYIFSNIPKAWLLCGIYIIIGVILVWLGKK